MRGTLCDVKEERLLLGAGLVDEFQSPIGKQIGGVPIAIITITISGESLGNSRPLRYSIFVPGLSSSCGKIHLAES